MKSNSNGNKDKKDKTHVEACEGDCGCGNHTEEGCGCLTPDEKDVEDATEISEDMGGGEIGILNKKIENLEVQLKDKTDEMLRRVADMDNYRKRLEREADDRAKYANQSVVADFIKVLDNIELTLQYTEKDSKLYEGIELTIKSFKDTLAKYGAKEIDAEVGTKFDPAFHEGIMLSNDEEYPSDTITLCVQRGFTLNGRVVRPSKVRVNKL